jgi:hemoglobin/transferrin/lactoferrin receptor protein
MAHCAGRARALLGVSLLALLIGTTSAGAQGAMTLDPITVLATRTEEKTTESLSAVSTVRQEQIQQIMPTRSSDIFWGIPGITFQERADDPGMAINIRGLQDFGRVAVVVDGARQNFQRTGHNADGLVYFDPEMIAAADVVRGPVANIFGSGAIGGVVSLRTKDVDDVLRAGQRWGVLAHGFAASNLGQGLGSAFAAARVNPNVDVIVGGSYRDKENYRAGNGAEVINSWNQTASGLAKATLRPAPGHEIKLTGTAYDTNFRNGLPNAANSATIYDTNVQNYVASAAYRYARPEDRLFDFSGSAYWTQTSADQRKIAGGPGTTFSSGPIGSVRNFTIDTVGFDLNNTSRFDTGPLRHAFTYGIDHFTDRVSVVDPAGTGDLFTPNGERRVSGGFVQLKSNYSSWLEVIGALRYDSYELDGGAVSSSGDRVSPKVTVGITPVPWFTIYGTYAEGYRAPAISETLISGLHPAPALFAFLPNPSLNPEVGQNKEVGINIRQDGLLWQGDSLRIKANYFINDIENFIEQVSIPFMSFGVGGARCTTFIPCIQYQNIPEARIQGFEFESHYDAGRWFAGLSASQLEGENLTRSVPLLKIPARQVATTFGTRFYDRKMTAAVRWLWVDAKHPSEIPLSSTGALSLPNTNAYNVVNLYFDYRPNEDLILAAGIDNIFNAHYARYLDVYTVGTAIQPSPSPGITFKGSIKVRFGDAMFKNG